ncbi:hypothetical protein [Flavobacterium sp.]|uniref:hypothetical protein n=1 Tax=Flavobacterium sp. TaxID=239 RepID=UPI00374D47FD
MLEINYKNFEIDCREIFGKYLLEYNFKEIHDEVLEFEKIYENEFWKIEISMISNFPHIGISFEFISKENGYIKNSVLEELLGIDRKKNIEIHDRLFNKEYYNKSSNEQYKIEMIFCVEILELSYTQLLIGNFTYSDYKNYIQ